MAANLHEQLRHVVGPAPQPWTEAAIEVGALRVELVARVDADVMIEGPPQRQACELSLVRVMHDSARMTAHRDADGDNWLFGTAGAAGGSSCGWLAVGLLALFVAGCGENSPLCEGCVVVDGVPGITNMTLDREGRIVATVQGVSVKAVARLDRSGVLDPGFGDRGLAAIERSFDPRAIVVRQSGAIAIGSAAAAEDEPVVYGFTPDGRDDGVRITGIGLPTPAAQYLMDQSGVLFASHARNKGDEGALVRYAESGVRDASFGPIAVERAVAITTDGAFVTAGRSLDDNPRRFLARRVTRDGQADASFGGGAVVIPDVDRGTGEIRVAARSGGGLVMSGLSGDTAPKLFVARFDGTGTLDASFGGRGYVTHDLGETSIVAIAERPDGSVVLAGTVPARLSVRALIVQLAPDGSLDTRFGDGGRLVVDRDDSFFSSLVVMADGEVIAGGSSGDGALLMTFPPGA